MSRPAARIAVAILAIALGIWGGAKLYSVQRSARGVPTAVGRASAPLPEDSEGVLGMPSHEVKIPDRLPEFALEDRAGRKTPISSFAGKSLIINFWATWCAPCRNEMPLLQSLSSEWAGRNVEVIGIAVDHRDSVLAFADKFKIGYPILIGDEDAMDAAAALGVQSPMPLPFTVFTDRRGEVVALFLGALHREQAELILAKVADLDRDLVKLPDARKAISAGLRTLRLDKG